MDTTHNTRRTPKYVHVNVHVYCNTGTRALRVEFTDPDLPVYFNVVRMLFPRVVRVLEYQRVATGIGPLLSQRRRQEYSSSLSWTDHTHVCSRRDQRETSTKDSKGSVWHSFFILGLSQISGNKQRMRSNNSSRLIAIIGVAKEFVKQIHLNPFC